MPSGQPVRTSTTDESRRTKVLLVLRDLPFHGGVPRASLALARYRDVSALDVRVLSIEPPSPEMVDEFNRWDVAVSHAPSRGYLGAAGAVRRIVREESIDVLVATAFRPYLVAKLATAGSRTATVFWIQSIPKVMEGPLRRGFFRRAGKRDPLIFISRAVAGAHRFPAHTGDRAIIYYGITDPFTDDSIRPALRSRRAEFDLPEDARVIGYTAEFIDWKDHQTLLGAFSELSTSLDNVYLILIGTGGEREELERAARLLPGGDRIRFLGARKDARTLLGLMDVYAHPARGEGFGLAVAEAMAAGVPVVTSDEGAFPEFVSHGRNGLTFSGGDSADLAKQILSLLRAPEFAAELGRFGREYCLTHFAPERFASETTDFLTAVAGSRTSATLAAP